MTSTSASSSANPPSVSPAVVAALLTSHSGDTSAAAFRARYPLQMAYLQERLHVPAAAEIYAPNEERLAVRPRFFFGAVTLTELRRRAADPRYAAIVAHIRASANRTANQTPPELVKIEEHDPNRGYVDALTWMAMAVLIEPDAANRQHTINGLMGWIRAMKRWGPFHNNLPLAQGTISLSLVYDWLHDELPPADLALIRELIIAQARFSLDETRGTLTMWRGQRFAANHNWANHSARAFAALTLWGDDAAPLRPGELQFWLDDAMVDFWIVKHTHTTDGAPLEGPSYQDYGLRFYLDFITQTETLLHVRESFFDEHMRALSARLFTLLPGNKGAMVYADGYPDRWWGTASHFRFLATHFQDAKFQLLADLMDRATPPRNRGSWRDLFAYDPQLPPALQKNLPLTEDMSDFGLYTARSDWSAQAAFFGLRCGPASGEGVKRTFGYDFGEAHAHPNQGDFTFYVGATPIFPGCEYAEIKRTQDHNLIVFEGRDSQKGQEVGELGEGGAWFNSHAAADPDSNYALAERSARVIAVEHRPDLHHYLCDLGGLYRLRDERMPGGFFYADYLRSLVFLPDGAVAIVDRVRLPVARTFSFRLLTGAKNLVAAGDGFNFEVGGLTGRMDDFSPLPMERSTKKVSLATQQPSQRWLASWRSEERREAIFAVVVGVGEAVGRYRIATDSTGYSLNTAQGTRLLRIDWP